MTIMPPTGILVIRPPSLGLTVAKMGNKVKLKPAYRDGWKAAKAGLSRSANPYGAASPEERADWFRGYDGYLS
jgi:ribosome modulation factor